MYKRPANCLFYRLVHIPQLEMLSKAMWHVLNPSIEFPHLFQKWHYLIPPNLTIDEMMEL